MKKAENIFSKADEKRVHEVSGGILSETAEAIGYIAIYWSFLEFTLMNILSEWLSIDLGLSAITLAETSFLQRVSMITSMMDYSNKQEWIDQWLIIEKDISELRTKRNDVIHGYWHSDDKNNMLVRLKSRRKLSVTKTPKTSGQLKELWQDILNAIYKIQVFREKLARENVKAELGHPERRSINRARSQKSHIQDRDHIQKIGGRQPRPARKLSSAQKRVLRNAAEKEDS